MSQDSRMPRTPIAVRMNMAASRREHSEIGRDGLLTVGEVAQLLGMSVRWVHERTRRREIPCYRFGAALRFDPQEIAAWAAKFHHPPEDYGTGTGRVR